MNGVYLRALPPDEYAHELLLYLGEQGYDWDAELVHKAAPLVQEKIEKLGDFPAFAGFLFDDVSLDGPSSTRRSSGGRARSARSSRSPPRRSSRRSVSSPRSWG